MCDGYRYQIHVPHQILRQTISLSSSPVNEEAVSRCGSSYWKIMSLLLSLISQDREVTGVLLHRDLQAVGMETTAHCFSFQISQASGKFFETSIARSV